MAQDVEFLIEHHQKICRIFSMLAKQNIEPDGTKIREHDSITKSVGELIEAETIMIQMAVKELTDVAECFQAIALRLMNSIKLSQAVSDDEAETYEMMFKRLDTLQNLLPADVRDGD